MTYRNSAAGGIDASQLCLDGDQSCYKLGIPQRKKMLHGTDIARLLFVWACFGVTLVTVGGIAGDKSIPWHLGVTRQFQIIGALLNLMFQTARPIASSFFILVEANTHSYLQNYDAILQNSIAQSKTQATWRIVLLFTMTISPTLSVVYKNFDHGTGYSNMPSAGNYYGLVPPTGLYGASGHSLSLMANSTTPFISATGNLSKLPTFPQAYGYNTLLLSNTSSARLDLPQSTYLQELQGQLAVDEAFTLSAVDVGGIVTTYNSTVETERYNDNFWNYYLSELDETKDQFMSANQSDRDDMLNTATFSGAIFNHWTVKLVMSNLGFHNTSWLLIALQDDRRSDAGPTAFRNSAMLFQTRRESCKGTWRITYNDLQLIDGSCDQPRLSDKAQEPLTHAQLAMPTIYLQSLCEYLEPFSDTRNQSTWKVPTFATVLAGMYWSRLAMFDGIAYLSGGATGPPGKVPMYHASHRLISERPVMNTSPVLFFVLAVVPISATLVFIGYLLLYRSVPFDVRGFGTAALLAGVRVDTLALLNGASVSGKLTKYIRIRVDPLPQDEGRRGPTEVQYVLIDDNASAYSKLSESPEG